MVEEKRQLADEKSQLKEDRCFERKVAAHFVKFVEVFLSQNLALWKKCVPATLRIYGANCSEIDYVPHKLMDIYSCWNVAEILKRMIIEWFI